MKKILFFTIFLLINLQPIIAFENKDWNNIVKEYSTEEKLLNFVYKLPAESQLLIVRKSCEHMMKTQPQNRWNEISLGVSLLLYTYPKTAQYYQKLIDEIQNEKYIDLYRLKLLQFISSKERISNIDINHFEKLMDYLSKKVEIRSEHNEFNEQKNYIIITTSLVKKFKTYAKFQSDEPKVNNIIGKTIDKLVLLGLSDKIDTSSRYEIYVRLDSLNRLNINVNQYALHTILQKTFNSESDKDTKYRLAKWLLEKFNDKETIEKEVRQNADQIVKNNLNLIMKEFSEKNK